MVKDYPYTDYFKQLVTRIMTGNNSNNNNCLGAMVMVKGRKSTKAVSSSGNAQIAITAGWAGGVTIAVVPGGVGVEGRLITY